MFFGTQMLTNLPKSPLYCSGIYLCVALTGNFSVEFEHLIETCRNNKIKPFPINIKTTKKVKQLITNEFPKLICAICWMSQFSSPTVVWPVLVLWPVHSIR